MKSCIYLVLAGLFFNSCSNPANSPADSGTQNQLSENTAVFENDLESALSGIPSWSNEKTIVNMPEGIKAHSGDFVTKVDNINLYSYAFKETLENINQKLPTKVIVNGWYFSTEKNNDLSIVMDINKNNESIIWKSYRLMEEETTLHEWHEFTAAFTIDQPIQLSYNVKIFAYSGKKTAYFDDLKVTFEY